MTHRQRVGYRHDLNGYLKSVLIGASLVIQLRAPAKQSALIASRSSQLSPVPSAREVHRQSNPDEPGAPEERQTDRVAPRNAGLDPAGELFFQHHNVDLSMKDPDIDKIGNESVPPAEMIADQQDREPPVSKIAGYFHTVKMPPDHEQGIDPEKEYIERFMPGPDHRGSGFEPVKLPPRSPWRFVVLPVVTEEITRKHGPPMPRHLSTRTVWHHHIRMRQAMRPVGPKIEQLESGKNRWNNPEK